MSSPSRLLLIPSAAADDPSSKWAPYSGPGDFGTNVLIVLAVLFVALLFAISLSAAIRFLFRAAARRRLFHHPHPPPAEPEKLMAALVFSAGTKLAGVEAECAICLTEFVEGERVNVLAPCNHGFHVRCIEPWLAARSSCPTCRATCHVAVGSEGNSPAVAEA